ncbi:hypothetical protein ACQKOH_02315 [Sphingomonas sp. NPDC092331]|jgi:hypothetical protein|nr:hypothetical protein [Pseudomonadota bacterium]
MKAYIAGTALFAMSAWAAPAAADQVHTFSNGCTRTCSGTWVNGSLPGAVACYNKDGTPGTVGPLNCPSGPEKTFSPNIFDADGIPLPARAIKANPRRAD